MLEKPTQLLRVIKDAINVELDGYHFYNSAAARTKDSKGKAVFRSLAQDELDHRNVLLGLHKAIKDKTDFKLGRKRHKSKVTKRSKSPIFSAEFKRKIKEDNLELSVLRIGQLLERNAMEFYSKNAKRGKHREMKSLFNFLSEWEKDHLEALVQQERYLRGKL
jgi:rubrerythrin